MPLPLGYSCRPSGQTIRMRGGMDDVVKKVGVASEPNVPPTSECEPRVTFHLFNGTTHDQENFNVTEYEQEELQPADYTTHFTAAVTSVANESLRETVPVPHPTAQSAKYSDIKSRVASYIKGETDLMAQQKIVKPRPSQIQRSYSETKDHLQITEYNQNLRDLLHAAIPKLAQCPQETNSDSTASDIDSDDSLCRNFDCNMPTCNIDMDGRNVAKSLMWRVDKSYRSVKKKPKAFINDNSPTRPNSGQIHDKQPLRPKSFPYRKLKAKSAASNKQKFRPKSAPAYLVKVPEIERIEIIRSDDNSIEISNVNSDAVADATQKREGSRPCSSKSTTKLPARSEDTKNVVAMKGTPRRPGSSFKHSRPGSSYRPKSSDTHSRPRSAFRMYGDLFKYDFEPYNDAFSISGWNKADSNIDQKQIKLKREYQYARLLELSKPRVKSAKYKSQRDQIDGSPAKIQLFSINELPNDTQRFARSSSATKHINPNEKIIHAEQRSPKVPTNFIKANVVNDKRTTQKATRRNVCQLIFSSQSEALEHVHWGESPETFKASLADRRRVSFFTAEINNHIVWNIPLTERRVRRT
jgi:hypothetical protein